MHEPFYTSGTYSSDSMDVSVGWIDHGLFSDSLPVWNESRDICLIFSGAHFSDLSGRQSAREAGLNVSLEDASYLVRLYQEHGMRFFELLNGSFCGVILDLREKKIILFNDRYGLNRIYYCETQRGFFFSSEAKALLKALPELRQVDPKGLSEWFACGCVLQNRTLFQGVSILPAGSSWTFFSDGRIEKQSYFRSDLWENQPALSPTDYSQRLKETFPRVLKRYFRNDQAIGMSLTGGLDGRMVMAWSRRNPGELPCYTFTGPYRECADVRIARQVALTCSQPHQVIAVGDQFLSEFPALAEKTVYITDGAMDVTGAAELYVNRLAREIAPIRMTGNYGSEVLRRNVAFRPSTLSGEIFDADLCSLANKAAAVYEEERRGNQLSFIAFKQVPWHHYARLAVEQSQLTVRSPFLDNELVALAFQAPAEAANSPEPLWQVIAGGNPALGQIPTDRGVSYQSNSTLTKIRRPWQQFLTKAEYAFDYGMPQWLARIDRLLSPLLLERLFLGRQKFCHFRTWYRHQLARYIKEMLLDPRTLSRPYLNGRRLESMVSAHLNGNGNFTVEIQQILSMELMHRLLIERS